MIEEKKYISIKNLSEDDRPREKMMNLGRASLSNAELLAILIGSGSRNQSAVSLCQEILSSYKNDINKVAELTIHDLMKFKGIGEAKAISIVAALELGRRRTANEVKKMDAINSSMDIFLFLKHKFEDLQHEEFHIVLLNRANKIKDSVNISKGGISGTVVDGKIIFKKALEQNASSIILCHNHPSGNLNPSESDKMLTLKLKEFGKLIDLPILDHLIFTDDDYFSFADNGMI